MNLSKKDYNSLYRLQDKFLAWWVAQNLPFYLTGGTALGRFYLNHRYSEVLDFFVNADRNYPSYIEELKKKIAATFSVNMQQTIFADDFTRIFIVEETNFLKIEFINDVGYYYEKPEKYPFGLIDTPINILANKLTAVVGRDEPKDIFDIIHLSLNYDFKWPDVFIHAKQKAVVNELDVEKRLASFPIEWLENVNWLNAKLNKDSTKKMLNQIADDFLLGKRNSLGKFKIPLIEAKPIFN
jgi:predicted nucleotidyltransferase component of viral defense system